MKFSNLRLRVKLAAAFGVVLAIMAVSFAFVLVQTRRLADIERMNGVSSASIDRIDRLSGDLNAARAGVRKFLLTGVPADGAIVDASIADIGNVLSELRTTFEKDGPQFLPDIERYKTAVDSYIEQAIKKEQALSSDPATRPQAMSMVGSTTFRPMGIAVDGSFSALRNKVSDWSDQWALAGKSAMAQTEWIVAISGVLSMLVGAAMWRTVSRAIGGPLNGMTLAMSSLATGNHNIAIPARDQTDEFGEMAAAVQIFKEAAIRKIELEVQATEARGTADEERSRNETIRAEAAERLSEVVEELASGLNKLASGDLMHRLNQPFAAEYESLRANFNAAVEQLQQTIKAVSHNTGAIRSGTDQIATASDDLSRRTEQQAASLEQTAAALGEIASAVKQTAAGAAHARDVVKQTTADAKKSGEVVARTIAAMSGIERSSNQISSILGVIDEIAFQTNLLALNAGVEAARAGDAGRGFAVVASEVRALAQRSAEAAKEIKHLIMASEAEVKSGVQLVDETGKGLTHIVQQIAEISAIINEIATSADHQATGISEVNIAVKQMDQVTQQNAAMVEEATAATHSLAGDSEQLARAVSRFRVGEDTRLTPFSSSARVRPAAKVSLAAAAPKRHAAQAPKLVASQDSWEEF